MKKYEVTLTAHYEKTVSVYADSPEEAREKLKTVPVSYTHLTLPTIVGV